MHLSVSNEKGLTLIELCMAVIILGLLVVAVAPRIAGSYYDLQVKSTAKRIAGELKLIREQAVFTQSYWRLRITDDGKMYYVEQADDSVLPGVVNTFLNRSWKIRDRFVLEVGLHLTSTQLTIPCTPNAGWQQNRLVLHGRNGSAYLIQIKQREVIVERNDS